MHLYRVYTSDEEIKEQYAPSSSLLAMCAEKEAMKR